LRAAFGSGFAFCAAGNFRGLVVSARWATAYEVISPAAEILGNVATVAFVAANAIDMALQFEAVYGSSGSQPVKWLKYASLVGTVAQKRLQESLAVAFI
jgi:hypothetical protein